MTVRLLILSALLLLQACGMGQMVSNYFGGEDNAEPPAPLVEFEPSIKTVSRWSRSVGNGTDKQYLKLTPAVTEDRLYITSRTGNVVALSPDNGNTVWNHDTDEPLSSAAGVADALVLIGASNGKVLALDKDSGKVKWKARVPSEVLSAPQASQDIVVVRTVDGKLIGLDAESGDRRWVYERSVPALSLRGTSKPIIDAGVILAGFDGGHLAALELDSGKAVWETRVAIGSGRSELDRMVDIDSDPVLYNGVIYVSTFQGQLAALSSQGGRVLWQRDISSHSGLTVDETHVYVTDDNGHVWALEQISGNSAWKQEALQARASSAPVVIGPYVTVGDVEGYVHWMDKATGDFVARTRIDESPIIAAPASTGQVAYFYTSAGTLAALTYK